MKPFKTRDGAIITEADLERLGAAWDSGETPGHAIGPVIMGRPRLSVEPLVSVTVKMPESLVQLIETEAARQNVNRSELIRTLMLEHVTKE